MVSYELRLVDIHLLKPHEMINKERLEELEKEIKEDRILKKPIVADRSTLVVLDGHHRLEVLRKMGAKRIPVILVDYDDPRIIVKKWRENGDLEKNLVREAGIYGKLFPPKTSKHMVLFNEELKHIEVLQKRVDIKLEKLV